MRERFFYIISFIHLNALETNVQPIQLGILLAIFVVMTEFALSTSQYIGLIADALVTAPPTEASPKPHPTSARGITTARSKDAREQAR